MLSQCSRHDEYKIHWRLRVIDHECLYFSNSNSVTDDHYLFTMAVRLLLKSGLAVTALTATSGAICYHTDVLDNPWCSSLRIVRFGRAACAVSYPENQYTY